jgi:beta-lactamase class D
MRSATLLVGALYGCAPEATSTTSQASAPALHHPGCFLLHDMTTGRTQAWESQSWSVSTSPASTFKIPHALIGLETGVIPEADAVRPWDERKHSWAPWGREDQTLTTAIRESVVWYFQEVAAEVGRERMLAHLSQLDYGDAQVADHVTTFWLDGALTISGHDQLDFLRRFWSGALHVSKSHLHSVQAILSQPVTTLRERVKNPERFAAAWVTKAKLAFKTGATAHGTGSVTWLVGRVGVSEAASPSGSTACLALHFFARHHGRLLALFCHQPHGI